MAVGQISRYTILVIVSHAASRAISSSLLEDTLTLITASRLMSFVMLGGYRSNGLPTAVGALVISS